MDLDKSGGVVKINDRIRWPCQVNMVTEFGSLEKVADQFVMPWPNAFGLKPVSPQKMFIFCVLNWPPKDNI